MSCSISEKQINDNVESIVISSDIESSLLLINNLYKSENYKNIKESFQEGITNNNNFIKSIIIKMIENHPDKINPFLKQFKNEEGKVNLDDIVFYLDKGIYTDINLDDKSVEITSEISSNVTNFTKDSNLELEVTDNTIPLNRGKRIVKMPGKVLDDNTFAFLTATDIASIDVSEISSISGYLRYRASKSNKAYKEPTANGNFLDSLVKTYLFKLDFNAYEGNNYEDLLNNESLSKSYPGSNYSIFLQKIFPHLLKLKLSLSENYHIINGDDVALFDKSLRISGISDIILVNKETNDLSVLDVKSSLTNININNETLDKYKTQLTVYSKLLENIIGQKYTPSNKNYIFFISNDLNGDMLLKTDLITVGKVNLEAKLDAVAKFYKKMDAQIIGKHTTTKTLKSPSVFIRNDLFIGSDTAKKLMEEKIEKLKKNNDDSLCK